MCQIVNKERSEPVEQVIGPKNINNNLKINKTSGDNIFNNKNILIEFNNQELQLSSSSSSSSDSSETEIIDDNTVNNLPDDQEIIASAIKKTRENYLNLEKNNNLNKNIKYDYTGGDVLAKITQFTRKLFNLIKSSADNFKTSVLYKVLTSTTQPAHLIVVLVVSILIYVLWPNLMHSNHPQVHHEKNGIIILFYLGSFATHFGAQIWMTFVSGLALYFSLPRHIFGLCQEILFPKYYLMGTILSFVTLILFVKSNTSQWEANLIIQTVSLSLCAFTELIIRLYLAPPLLRLMKEKHNYEFKAGTGSEIGHHNQGGLKSHTPYQKIQKSFRRYHSWIAIGNIISLTCTCIHLQYLAQKITL